MLTLALAAVLALGSALLLLLAGSKPAMAEGQGIFPGAPGYAQSEITANTASTLVGAGAQASVLVTLTSNTTISVSNGYVGQTLRLDLLQDATGNRTVAFGSMVKFGTDITSFTASTAPNLRDLVQLICADGTNWMVAAINHGFGV